MLTVALGQLIPRIARPDSAAAAVAQAAASARRAGADLLVLPETLMTGYAIGAHRIAELAEAADGGQQQTIAGIAAENSLAVVYGFTERSSTGEIYNSANFVSESGQLLATYRKLHLFQEIDREQFSPGNRRPTVIDWHGWGVGLAICYDVEFPEMVRMLAEDGADLICTPTANMVGFDQVQNLVLPTRAYESQVYIAYANYCGQDEVFTYNGTSVIASPRGSLDVVASRDREEVCTSQLSLTVLEEARRLNNYLRDRRLDIYPRTV